MKRINKLELFKKLRTLESNLGKVLIQLYEITDEIQETLTDEEIKKIGGKEIPWRDFVEYIRGV